MKSEVERVTPSASDRPRPDGSDIRKMTWENAARLYRFDVPQSVIDSAEYANA